MESNWRLMWQNTKGWCCCWDNFITFARGKQTPPPTSYYIEQIIKVWLLLATGRESSNDANGPYLTDLNRFWFQLHFDWRVCQGNCGKLTKYYYGSSPLAPPQTVWRLSEMFSFPSFPPGLCCGGGEGWLWPVDMFCLINLVRYFSWLINIDMYYIAAAHQ